MLITIVIPTYNNDLLLQKSISSVVNQTFDNFELLIIDNHSADKTSEIILNLMMQDLSHKISNNGVISKSRNLGIKLAQGEWIAFLDSDDIWYPKRLEKISKFVPNNMILLQLMNIRFLINHQIGKNFMD